MKKQNIRYYFFVTIMLFGIISGCEKDIKVGTLSVDMKYFDKKQETTVGYSGEFGSFYFSKSSLPIGFEVERVWEEDGGSIAELSELVKISAYDQAVVTGDSELAEAMKTDTVEVPAVIIDKFTGKLIVHENNEVLPGTYHFDIRLTNVSGTKLLEDAIILKMNAFSLNSFSTYLGKSPEVTYLGASPNQMVFKMYKYNGDTYLFDKISTVDHLYLKREAFKNRSSYINEDTDEGGEIWDVEYPITFDGDIYNIIDGEYVQEGWLDMDLGQPGNYEIKIFIK